MTTRGYCQFTEGYRNQLDEDFEHDRALSWVPDFEHKYFHCREGIVGARSGYAWDGASGPTFETPATSYPSLMHDILLQAVGLGFIRPTKKNRKRINKLFRKLLERDGMRQPRRGIWYLCVKWFAPRRGSRPKRVITSPRPTVMALALFALVFCQGFTCAVHRDGHVLATTADLGIVSNGTQKHGASLIGLGEGLASTQRQSGNQEAERAGFINVGGENGITMRGTISNDNPAQSAADLLRDTVKIHASERVASKLIGNGSSVIKEAIRK